MINENLQKFLAFLAADKDRQAHVRSFEGNMDALAAYAQESGFSVSAQELQSFRENSLKFLEAKMKKAEEQKAAQSPGVQAIYALMALAETDSEVARQLEAMGPDVTRAELIAFGKEKGFIFGEGDLDAVGKDILEPSDELSEEELELVAGGCAVLLFVGGLVIGVLLIGGAAMVAGVFVFLSI